jgi:hypothetical protein
MDVYDSSSLPSGSKVCKYEDVLKREEQLNSIIDSYQKFLFYLVTTFNDIKEKAEVLLEKKGANEK